MPELDDLLDDGIGDTDLVKSLRKALKDANRQAKENADALAALRKGERTRSLADVLKDKGLPPKVAALYPTDGEATPEAIDAWLGEYGELFGIEKQETVASTETQQAAAALANASAAAPSNSQSFDADALAAEMAAATTPEALAAAMSKAGLAFS